MEAAALAAGRMNLNECIPAIKDSRRIGPSASVQTQGETCHVVSYRRCDTHHLKELHEWQQATRIQLAQWNATIGAQSDDLGRQALAFLPNEIWIHGASRSHGPWRLTRGTP